jgi:hypothetical protein
MNTKFVEIDLTSKRYDYGAAILAVFPLAVPEPR